uniref:Uncharacterized protein n=1 Tax=Anguilla anguilla TaxID=7936 RepID=A0A0E9PPI3_ANGAN
MLLQAHRYLWAYASIFFHFMQVCTNFPGLLPGKGIQSRIATGNLILIAS